MEEVTKQPAAADTNKAEETEEVKVPRSLLESMMKEIKELKEGQRNLNDSLKDKDPEEVHSQVVRLRIYNGDLVIGFDKVRGTWKKYDAERREDRLMMDIILYKGDKEETVTVDYLRFMEESTQVDVPVLEIKREPKETVKGTISVKEVRDYATVELPTKVKNKVTYTVDTVKVRLPDGAEKVLDVNFVNM